MQVMALITATITSVMLILPYYLSPYRLSAAASTTGISVVSTVARTAATSGLRMLLP